MGKSCSGKSCMALARVARLIKARRGNSKEAIDVQAHIRLKISAPINPMRPHKIFAGAPAVRAAGARPSPSARQRPEAETPLCRSTSDQRSGKRDFVLPLSDGRFPFKIMSTVCLYLFA